MTQATDIIASLRARLGEYPADTHPVEHAAIRFNLGLAIAESPHGDRHENLRRSIGEYAEALRGFDPVRDARSRARVLTAIGAAEHDLQLPIQARDHFLAALGLLDGLDAPAESGAAANGLGLALAALGERDDAIDAFRSALDAFGDGYGRQRASTLHNLGQAIAGRGTVEDLADACAVYREALELVRPDEAPYVFAALHVAFGLALMDLPDDRPARLTDAIRSFSSALEVFLRRTHPFQHALTKNNLGVAYEELAGGDPTTLRRALACLDDAVGLFDVRLHAEQWREARANHARVESTLAEIDPSLDGTGHFVALLTSVSAPERRDLLRYRLPVMFALAEPRRSQSLTRLDEAILELDPGPMSEVTRAWMSVLMEQPHEMLEDALERRQAGHDRLEGERLQGARSAIEDALGDLEIIQRVRVRDMLAELGYERPDSR